MKDCPVQIVILYNHENASPRGEPQDLIALQDTANTSRRLYQALCSLGYRSALLPVEDSLPALSARLEAYPVAETLIFFNCDGFQGRNYGSVQVAQAIEAWGYRHSGATAEAIARSTDKSQAKALLAAAGIPTPPYQVFERPSAETTLAFPLIVKPATEDGSLGIDAASVVHTPAGLAAQITYVLEHYCQPAIAEAFISGRELEVSVWGNDPVELLPVAENDFSRIADPYLRLLTYEAKWLADSYYYQNIFVRCPTVLSPQDAPGVLDTALRAYQMLGLRDLGRVDIRLHQHVPYVIDINDIPDLSLESGFPKSAFAAGYTYEQMVEKLIDIVLRREGLR